VSGGEIREARSRICASRNLARPTAMTATIERLPLHAHADAAHVLGAAAVAVGGAEIERNLRRKTVGERNAEAAFALKVGAVQCKGRSARTGRSRHIGERRRCGN